MVWPSFPVTSNILEAALPDKAQRVEGKSLLAFNIAWTVEVLPQLPVINILLFLLNTSIWLGTVKQYSYPSLVLYFSISVLSIL